MILSEKMLEVRNVIKNFTELSKKIVFEVGEISDASKSYFNDLSRYDSFGDPLDKAVKSNFPKKTIQNSIIRIEKHLNDIVNYSQSVKNLILYNLTVESWSRLLKFNIMLENLMFEEVSWDRASASKVKQYEKDFNGSLKELKTNVKILVSEFRNLNKFTTIDKNITGKKSAKVREDVQFTISQIQAGVQDCMSNLEDLKLYL
jgi:hypothetical protein